RSRVRFDIRSGSRYGREHRRGVYAALVTAPGFKPGCGVCKDARWVRFPSTPDSFSHGPIKKPAGRAVTLRAVVCTLPGLRGREQQDVRNDTGREADWQSGKLRT